MKSQTVSVSNLSGIWEISESYVESWEIMGEVRFRPLLQNSELRINSVFLILDYQNYVSFETGHLRRESLLSDAKAILRKHLYPLLNNAKFSFKFGPI